jgi:ceramide glucosyltransferase
MNALLAVSGLLLLVAAFGLTADVVQFVITWATFRRRPVTGSNTLGISILKPLCGADDDLAENLRQFATLPYPNYELILGVKSAQDPAYAVGMAAVKRWPRKVKLVIQRGEPGLNPKVNQLCTMVDHATKELVLVSDSNCRVPEGYLEEIAAIFETDPTVACTSNPIIGIGEERLGSVLDNLYVATVVTTGVVAAKWAGRDLVVGKSMALRRSDLDKMGGFHAARNHLAEDYVLGKKVAELGKRVRICQLPVYQVSQKRTYPEFMARQRRWAIIHRTAIAPITYIGQAAMNPIPLTLLALLAYPSRPTLVAFAATWALKALLDWGAIRLHRPAFGLRTPFYVMLKDLSLFMAWCYGAYRRSVLWRGTRLRVEHGSRLRAPEPEGAEALPSEPALAPAAWTPSRRDRNSDRTAA